MSFESPSHIALVTNLDRNAPKASYPTSANTFSTAISRAAAKLTPSRVEGARASFDLQMNSYVKAEDKPENSPGSAAREEAPLPGTLNPYHDGRIRTAVPSKLKGRTIENQGNFSVLQMQVQKPEMTARDLAAKRTSEGTAAAAKLASSQGYRHPRRLRLQSAITSPASVPVAMSPTQTLSTPQPQLPSVIPPASRPNPLPHIPTLPANQERSSKKQAVAAANLELDINAHQVGVSCTKPNGLHDVSPEHSRGSYVVETTQEINTEQIGGPVTEESVAQDIDVEVSDEPFMTIDSPGIETEHTSEVNVMGEVNKEKTREMAIVSREANAGHSAKPGYVSRPLSPSVVKAEQARMLTLFRYTQPRFIVDQLVEALTHFGTMPDVPTMDTSLFTQSASNNGPGNLFVSWLSEIFPAIPLESHKMKKPPTGRPRGRPKGSIASYNKQTTAAQSASTVFVPRPLGPHERTSAQTTLIGDGPNILKQAVGNAQGPGVVLSPVPIAESPAVTIIPTLREQVGVPLPHMADSSSRTVAIPRMRSIFPSTALAAEVPASNPTPLQRKKPTGRPRGRPPGSKNKLKAIAKVQVEKSGRQDSRPDRSNYSASQSGAFWHQQPNSGSPDTTESTVVNPDQAVTRTAQTGTSNSLDSVKEKRKNVDPNLQRTSQQGPPREGPGAVLPQASGPTAPQASSSQQAKRRRLSHGIMQRDPVSFASSISGSPALSHVFESNLSIGSQSVQSHQSQHVSRHQIQDWDMEHLYQGQQPQSQLHPHVQKQFHPQQLSRNTGSGT